MPRNIAKANLPRKICQHCGREFVWRKKWTRDWDQVLYCSHACKAKKTPIIVQPKKPVV